MESIERRKEQACAAKDEQRLEEVKKEWQAEIRRAKDLWREAGNVCGGALKQDIGGREFNCVLRLMNKVISENLSQWVGMTRIGMIYLVGGVRLSVQGDRLLLEQLRYEEEGVKSLELSSFTDGYNFRFFTFQPEREDGNFDVQILKNKEGEIGRIYYSCRRWEQKNVSGGVVRKEIDIKNGEIVPGLQIAEGPPR